MFDHKHYVPILKTKAGERWAIDRLDLAARQFITPLFEIHSHKKKGDVEHAQDVCDALNNVWPDSLFFLDTLWLHDIVGDPSILEGVFNYARAVGLQAIPVVRTTYDQATLDVIRDIDAADSRGCLVRYPASELAAAASAIPPVVAYLQIPPDRIDLMLDYRHHPMNLAGDVPSLPTVHVWRTFSAASGACPRSMATYPLNVWHQLPRHDWMTWEAGVVGGGLTRKPAFSDYTVRDPGPPVGGGDPPVSLKYTSDSHWLARLGRKFQAGFSTDIYAICADLVTRSEYRGPTFSIGDAAISRTAQRLGGPGSPQYWLQWAMNHHMTFVADQIQSHHGI